MKEKREPQMGHGWTRMECAGRLPALREWGRSVMWRMVVLLLGGNTSLPMYGSVAWAAGGGGNAERGCAGFSEVK